MRVFSADATVLSHNSSAMIGELIASSRKKRQRLVSGYINARFVLGSAAEVERLWSLAGNMYDPSMSPLMLETILFLKA